MSVLHGLKGGRRGPNRNAADGELAARVRRVVRATKGARNAGWVEIGAEIGLPWRSVMRAVCGDQRLNLVMAAKLLLWCLE
jgi:hypothetical protein